MPRKMNLDKLAKSMGADSIKQEGGSYQLVFDASKLAAKNPKLADGLVKASAAKIGYNAPFDASFFDGPGAFDNLSVHNKIKLAQKYAQTDPLAGRIIEMLTVFANDGMKNESKNEKIKKTFDKWCKSVDIDLVLSWVFHEYFRSGNVPIYRVLLPYKPGMFDSKEDDADYWTNAAKKNEWSRRQIPVAYSVLNPATVIAASNNAYKDKLYETDIIARAPLNQEDPFEITVKSGDSVNMLKKLVKEEKIKPLAEKNISRILRMRLPYEPYGSILMERAFAALYEKNKLRQMDMTMVNSAINQLVVVTVGNDNHPATPRHLKALADQFQNVGKSQTIFWNHTLKIDVVRPNIDVLNSSKYERVNEDIRNAFGISEIMIGSGGSKTNFAVGYLSLKGFLTIIEQARKDVARWLEGQYKDIADSLGIDEIPQVTFNQMKLTDEIAEKQIVMQLIDRGIISYQTGQSKLGFDPQAEKARREEEVDLIKDGVFGFLGNPLQQQQIAKEENVVMTEEDKVEVINTEDDKMADNSDQKTSQKNRKMADGKNPSVALPQRGLEGRPKTPRGNYPSRRKQATEKKL